MGPTSHRTTRGRSTTGLRFAVNKKLHDINEFVFLIKLPQCEHWQCVLAVCHILVECNHFAGKAKDIFGKINVVGSFRFHAILILFYLKESQFNNTF